MSRTNVKVDMPASKPDEMTALASLNTRMS
jgi:hypothetical protein